MDKPLVSVIMPAYNAELYIGEAIESVVNQTFQNWELIIINDGSTDGTLNQIKRFKNSKIRLYESVNRGQAYQLNYGISISKGNFIAIAHADDISLPTRLEKQVAFLAQNLSIGVCGSAIKLFGAFTEKAVSYPTDPSLCYQELFFGNPLAHPAIMINALILKESKLEYDDSYQAAEDYNLWIRLCYFTKLSNLSEILVHYRIHQNQISQLKKNEEEDLVRLSRIILIEQLCKPTGDYYNLIFSFVYEQEKLCANEQWQAVNFLSQKIIKKKLMVRKLAMSFSLSILKRNLYTLPYCSRLIHLPLILKYKKMLTVFETFILFKNLFLKKSV